MVLFDLKPKDSLDDLYGRDKEVVEIQNLIKHGRWVAVLGPRMVGKTSIVKAACADLKKYRYAYINLWGVRDSHGFLQSLVHGVNSSKDLFGKLKNLLAHVEEFSVGPQSLSIKRSKHPMNNVWDVMSAIGALKDNTVIVLDEVQELYRIYHHVLKMLANIFNTYNNVTFVFTGSMVGLIRSLLEPPSTSPLYGRAPVKIYVNPFTESQSIQFLMKGFAEQKQNLAKKNTDEVVAQLDGTPGWLTLYGNYVTIAKLSHKDALKETQSQASKIIRAELEHFLEGRNKFLYIQVLKIIAYSDANWSLIRQGIEAVKGSPLNDKTLKDIIDSLSDSMYIAKSGDFYQITDPLIRATVKNIRL